MILGNEMMILNAFAKLCTQYLALAKLLDNYDPHDNVLLSRTFPVV